MKEHYKSEKYRSRSDERNKHKTKQRDKNKHKKKKYRRSSSSQQRYRRRSRSHEKVKVQQQIQVKQENIEVQEQKPQIQKQEPCFQPSGILLKFYNARQGISLKFHEPPESKRPIDIWRIYIFKDQQLLKPILLDNSSYLLGKDQRVCDILCQNPSISRQHSVIQFRRISKMLIDGSYYESIKPYIMDLESTNGTFLNQQKIEHSRYIELLHKDVLKFGFSDRLYVMVKEQVQQEQLQQEE